MKQVKLFVKAKQTAFSIKRKNHLTSSVRDGIRIIDLSLTRRKPEILSEKCLQGLYRLNLTPKGR